MGLFDKIFKAKKSGLVLGAHVQGEAVPLSEVSDPTFGEEIMGKGVAVKPTGNKVVAPCDATVDMMFDTGHAVSLVADSGAEILIHVGLDTVNLKGQHYTVIAKNGDHVKKGDLLMEFDIAAIQAAGYDTVTPIVICNSDNYTDFIPHVGADVSAGDVILELTK